MMATNALMTFATLSLGAILFHQQGVVRITIHVLRVITATLVSVEAIHKLVMITTNVHLIPVIQ